MDLIAEEQLKETCYLIAGGFRRVLPYVYTFHVFAKGRWYSMPLLQLLLHEYRSYNEEYYRRAIKSGRIRINGNLVDPDYVIKEHDELTHAVHRHEPPITDKAITIIHQDEELVVIDKPPSIPVHPSGRFRHNTVVFILAKEHGFNNLHLVHRIDRLTSGILLLGRNPAVAGKISEKVRTNEVVKHYLAKVHGQFPDGKQDVNQPIKSAVKGRGINCVHPSGKASRTVFLRLAYNPLNNSSLVLCRLYTGRTHQIRVHLQWFGYPILNDPLYNLEKVDKIQKGFDEVNLQRYAGSTSNQPENTQGPPPPDPPKEASPPPQAPPETSPTSEIEAECLDCRATFPDPEPHEMVQYLHAYSYQSHDWQFKTPLPDWSLEYQLNATQIPLPLQ
uniref:Pseudouridine synthase n=1 Tax=Arcella intermedia TaxID=1963864 RepID=A0A6B2L5J1_9EUKA